MSKQETPMAKTTLFVHKTVDEIVSQFSQIVDDLKQVIVTAQGNIDDAENANRVWQQCKSDAESEMNRAQTLIAKLEALLA